MATILMPIPCTDFDPTEAGVPWTYLQGRGHSVVFATPDGRPGQADERMLTGRGLGPLAAVLKADKRGRLAYEKMTQARAFRQPLPYADVRLADYDGILLPGGHAPGMKPYLESSQVQALVMQAFAQDMAVGAICHGVLVAARATNADGQSALNGRKTTALTRQMELTAWSLTCTWLGSYYRTYPRTVQQEVTDALGATGQFLAGPRSIRRDRPDDLSPGFVVRDGRYLSARWPGDAHRFAAEYARMLEG
jgi:protease I